jgi:hypothetical protein
MRLRPTIPNTTSEYIFKLKEVNGELAENCNQRSGKVKKTDEPPAILRTADTAASVGLSLIVKPCRKGVSPTSRRYLFLIAT